MFKSTLCFIYALLTMCSISLSQAAALPDVPLPLKNGTGAINGSIIYVGLGSAGKNWFRIDVAHTSPAWEKIAEFPAQPREQAVSVMLNGKLYVFGGVGKTTESEANPQALTEVYRYDPSKNRWEKVPTRAPQGLVGTAIASLDGQRAWIMGGVNKQVFDGYFQDLSTAQTPQQKDAVAQAYFNQAPESYFFNREIMIYNPTNNQWRSGGQLPQFGRAGSAIAARQNRVILINGEVKPGLRITEALKGTWQQDQMHWKRLPDLIPASDKKQQEGLAGSFAGISRQAILVAGGANFPGARDQFNAGQLYAHQGLKKNWHDEIYGLVNGEWKIVGKLPQPLGYGVSIQDGDNIWLIGGETENGAAVASIRQLSWDGNRLRQY